MTTTTDLTNWTLVERRNADGSVTEFVAHRYQIATTATVVHEVYEADDGHSTTRSVPTGEFQLVDRGAVWLGKVGTRKLPPELERLPVGQQPRIDRVVEFHREQRREAYAVLLEAYPYLGDDLHVRGTIERCMVGDLSCDRKLVTS